MRILFISQLFDPENSIKGLEFARRLKALGHEIEIVTTFPSYPGGKIYSGYKQHLKQVDNVDGIRIVRLPTFISHGTSAAKRMLSYASFGVVASCYGLFTRKRPDVIYAYYPPVVVGLTAMLVGKLRRAPFVYDVQDLWPEALVATGNVRADSGIVRSINRLSGWIYDKAARIVVLSDGYKNALIAKQVPAGKIERIFNWCDESRMDGDTMLRTDSLDPDCFNILYAGNLGPAQALEHVVEAAGLLQQWGNHRVRFIFLGAGVAESALKKQVSDLKLHNVQFLPRVTVDQVGAYLAAADVLLVHLASDPVFDITIPQKTQAYMLAGRPLLMAVGGEAGDIVRDADAGLVVQPCQPEQLAKTAIALSELTPSELKAMAEKGYQYYQEKMSMDNGVKSVNDLLQSITNTL